jgi:hypothetical protein
MNDENVQTEGQPVEQGQTQGQGQAPAQQKQSRGAQVRLPDGTMMPVREYVHKRFHETNADRGLIAKELGKTYQYVYNMTKDLAPPSGAARNRDAVISVVPGQAQPGFEGKPSTRKQGGNGGGTIQVGGGNQNVAGQVEEVSQDEIDQVLSEQTGEQGSSAADAITDSTADEQVEANQHAAE